MKLNHSSLYPLPPFFLSHCLLFRALFWTLPCIYIHPSSPFYAVYLSFRLLFSSLQTLIDSVSPSCWCWCTVNIWPHRWSDTLHTIWAHKYECSSCLLLAHCDWMVQSSSHTLHLAAQLLNSLCGGFVVMWELLPGGNRVGTWAVWQAALWGALVRRSLLLPVQMVLHKELQLWSSGKKWRWKVSDKSKVGRMGGAVPVGKCWEN